MGSGGERDGEGRGEGGVGNDGLGGWGKRGGHQESQSSVVGRLC